jgi:hypothetical protein
MKLKFVKSPKRILQRHWFAEVDPGAALLFVVSVKPIACVWRPDVFITAAMVKTQKESDCRKKDIYRFYTRSSVFGDFKQKQHTAIFLVAAHQTVFQRVKMNTWNGIKIFSKTSVAGSLFTDCTLQVVLHKLPNLAVEWLAFHYI